MAIHSSILAWRIPRAEEPGGLQSMGLQSWTQLSDSHTHTHTHTHTHFLQNTKQNSNNEAMHYFATQSVVPAQQHPNHKGAC